MGVNNIDEKRVKELVMAEVSKQIQPLHDWMLAFWSNGSGRPPGFFQMRIKADDERYGRLERETEKQSEVLERLDENLKTIASDKKAETDRKAKRAEFIATWLPLARWVGAGIGGILIFLAGFAYQQISPVLKNLWDDYRHAHPIVQEKPRSTSRLNLNEVYAVEKPASVLRK